MGAPSLAADPTLKALAALSDPTRFVCIPNVPIFKAHNRYDKDGDLVHTVTVKDLYTICRNSNALLRSGVVARGSLGHLIQVPRSDGTPPRETDQPPIPAVVTAFRVGTFGPSNEPAILATVYVRRENLADIKGYLFRSAEYYHDEQTIRGVAFLKRDPYLNLGIIDIPDAAHYERAGRGHVYFYSMKGTAMDNDEDETGTGGTQNAEETGPAEDAEGEGGDGGMPPEEEKKADQYMAYYQKKHPFMGYAMKCYEASAAAAGGGAGGAATPTGTNGALPGGDSEDEKMAGGAPYQKKGKMTPYDKRITALETANRALLMERERGRCERMVSELVAEGYSLDPEREVKTLLPLTAEARAAHVEYARQHYVQSPATEQWLPTLEGEVVKPGGQREFGPKEMARAHQYQADNRCSYAAAIAAVEKNLDLATAGSGGKGRK